MTIVWSVGNTTYDDHVEVFTSFHLPSLPMMDAYGCFGCCAAAVLCQVSRRLRLRLLRRAAAAAGWLRMVAGAKRYFGGLLGTFIRARRIAAMSGPEV